MAKKRNAEEVDVDDDPTLRKTRRSTQNDVHNPPPMSMVSSLATAETPSKRKSILRGTPSKGFNAIDIEPTPRSLRKVLFSTPAKFDDTVDDRPAAETPLAVKNDRSAVRKSRRVLHKHAGGIEDSDAEEDAAHDEAIAEAILEEENDDDDDDDDNDDNDNITVAKPSLAPDTPSKSTGKPRGRPKGKRRERTPSPQPADLPPHELYFFQNRAAGNKTSANALPSHLLLNHDDYFANVTAYQDPHEGDMKRLKQLHKRAFDQWIFELEEGFSICLYGYGSKRKLALGFAEHVYYQAEKTPTIVVVNGYTPGLTIRDVLTTLSSIVLPKTTKLPAQPVAMTDLLLETMDQSPPQQPLLLIVNSADHANLRKAVAQALLARLAAHPSISLLATCDTLNFALLWDITLTRQFRWLYHDATTFDPYSVEIDTVEEVNALLGRSGRRLGGKDGVGYVLKSLPENARNLFRILVAEQLALADVEIGAVTAGGGSGEDDDMPDADEMLGVEDEEEAARQQDTPSRRGRGRPAKKKKKQQPQHVPARQPFGVPAMHEGVEYRTLYHKAVEEFVCSSELNFRTLLKEFHDHQMIESRKDGMGTERLVVPFRREELEGILDELV